MKPKWKRSERGKALQRAWLKRRRDAFFADKHCALCAGRERLELDHIDPETKLASEIWSWSEPRRLAEIAKCRVLCRACHNKHHADEMRMATVGGRMHGTRGGYIKRKCRCDECVRWARAAWQRNNDKRRAAGTGPFAKRAA